MSMQTCQQPPNEPDVGRTRIKKVRSLDFSRLLTMRTTQIIEADNTNCGLSHCASQASLRRLASGADLVKTQSYDVLSSKTSCSASVNTDRRLDTNSTSTIMPETSFSLRIPSTLTLGKASVLILILTAFTDFALCQVHSLESPDVYDALSADVLRPPFAYHNNADNKPKRLGRLGSAAIDSVTEALSPILPFAGGVDLRREDYWDASPLETLRALTVQIRDAFSSSSAATEMPRGGARVRTAPKSNSKVTPRGPKTKRVASLSTPDPFVSVDAIADLTLSDLAETFRYAVESSKDGFNEARYIKRVAPRVKKVVTAMKDAVAKSRGKDAQDTSIYTTKLAGNVDALKFSAAMRVFAEWRILRQVPDGYKGFGVGIELGRKDIVQNVAKIEQAVHSWLDRRSDMIHEDAFGAEMVLRTPTVRELLLDEKELNVHPRLPYLKEKSAAMGLLWVRRQLHYQTLLFDNARNVPKTFATIAEAVGAAYQEVYDRYHGWAVQKIFSYSFQAAPPSEEIFQHMNPHRLKEVKEQAKRQSYRMVALDDAEMMDGPAFEQKKKNPLAGLFQHFGNKNKKRTSSDNTVLLAQAQPNSVQRGGAAAAALLGKYRSPEEFIGQEMTRDAHEHIVQYLEIVYPILDDLTKTFAEFNMEDPTRV